MHRIHMTTRETRAAAAVLFAFLAAPALPAAEPPGQGIGETARSPAPKTVTLALVGGRILDGYEGRPIEDGVILIAGERIVAVGARSEIAVPAGTPVIDTRGMSVLPGLADMHVHLMILGHGDYEHWDTVYRSRFRAEIMPNCNPLHVSTCRWLVYMSLPCARGEWRRRQSQSHKSMKYMCLCYAELLATLAAKVASDKFGSVF